jgi:hypothetical protein
VHSCPEAPPAQEAQCSPPLKIRDQQYRDLTGWFGLGRSRIDRGRGRIPRQRGWSPLPDPLRTRYRFPADQSRSASSNWHTRSSDRCARRSVHRGHEPWKSGLRPRRRCYRSLSTAESAAAKSKRHPIEMPSICSATPKSGPRLPYRSANQFLAVLKKTDYSQRILATSCASLTPLPVVTTRPGRRFRAGAACACPNRPLQRSTGCMPGP